MGTTIAARRHLDRRIGALVVAFAISASACAEPVTSAGSGLLGSTSDVGSSTPSIVETSPIGTSSPAPSIAPSAHPTPAPSPPAPTDLGTRLVATIDGIAKPCALAASKDSVWVTGDAPSRLARIDPTTNRIVSRVPTDGSPCGIAVGPDGRVWMALLGVGRVVAVDPASSKVVATIDGLGTNLWDLKAAFGAVWVVDRTNRQLDRIDPATAKIVAQVGLGPSGSGLGIAGGAVWVVDDVDGSVRKIDPATNMLAATVTLGRGASWFADDGTSLVAANRIDGSITPLDPTAAVAGPSIDGAAGPLDGTVVGERAYIPDGSARTMLEIDLTASRLAIVDRLDGAINPFVAEVAFGDVWVLDYGGKRIWRIHATP